LIDVTASAATTFGICLTADWPSFSGVAPNRAECAVRERFSI